MTRLSVARIIGSIDNNVSYSSPYGPSEFNVSAPGSGCTNLNQSALPGNLNAINVWEWIPADLAVLPPNNGAPETSGVSSPNNSTSANNGWTIWAGAVLGCMAGGIAGAGAGSLIPGPGTAVGAVAGCVMGAGSADFGTPTWP